MIIEAILFSIGGLFIVYAMYNFELAKLYSANNIFLNVEKKRKENNFNIDFSTVTRGPGRFGNRYEEDVAGSLTVKAEERSSVVSYI